MDTRPIAQTKASLATVGFTHIVPTIAEERKLSYTQLYQLKDLNWIDAHVNILFLGPPGIGKTMLAVGLGLEAINAGYSVCFERMASLMEIVDTAKTSRASNFRLRRIRRADLVIVDEIGFTPIRWEQANSFFNLVSEMYEKTSKFLPL